VTPPSPSDSVIDLQRTAGNRATTQVLARQPPTKAPARRRPPGRRPPKHKPLTQKQILDISADYTNAHAAVLTHFQRIRNVLLIRNEVHETAINNFKTFSALKDPPSLSEAILTSIFESVIGLIPGGAAIKMGLTTEKQAQFEDKVHGEKPSKALLRRIAALTDQPIVEQHPWLVGRVLKMHLVHRRRIIQTMTMPPRAG
jgi:hypothetical protein